MSTYIGGQTLIPGDPGATQTLIGSLRLSAGQLTDAAGRLRTRDLGGAWRGDAAAAFVDLHRDLPRLLDRVHDRFAGTADALAVFAYAHGDLISRARQLELDAADIAREQELAAHQLQTAVATPRFVATGTLSPEEISARDAVDRASASARWLQQRRNELLAEWDALARQTGDTIRDHCGDLDDDNSLFHHVSTFAGNALGGLGHATWKTLEDALDEFTAGLIDIPGIGVLRDALKVICPILDILVLVPGLGQLILPVAVVLTATLLVIDFAEAYQGKGSWVDVGFDALSVAAGSVAWIGAARRARAAKEVIADAKIVSPRSPFTTPLLRRIAKETMKSDLADDVPSFARTFSSQGWGKGLGDMRATRFGTVFKNLTQSDEIRFLNRAGSAMSDLSERQRDVLPLINSLRPGALVITKTLVSAGVIGSGTSATISGIHLVKPDALPSGD